MSINIRRIVDGTVMYVPAGRERHAFAKVAQDRAVAPGMVAAPEDSLEEVAMGTQAVDSAALLLHPRSCIRGGGVWDVAHRWPRGGRLLRTRRRAVWTMRSTSAVDVIATDVTQHKRLHVPAGRSDLCTVDPVGGDDQHDLSHGQ